VAKGCDDCLRHNIGRVGFHSVWPIMAVLPWDHLVFDLKGPYKTTERGYNFILVIKDVATRFIVLKLLRSKDIEEIVW